jgi:hypothetical protein
MQQPQYNKPGFAVKVASPKPFFQDLFRTLTHLFRAVSACGCTLRTMKAARSYPCDRCLEVWRCQYKSTRLYTVRDGQIQSPVRIGPDLKAMLAGGS